MWDCGISYPINFGTWFLGGGIVGFTIKSLIIIGILVFLYNLIRLNNSKITGNLDKKDSLNIIKERFAKGEINEQEYQRMKNILS